MKRWLPVVVSAALGAFIGGVLIAEAGKTCAITVGESLAGTSCEVDILGWTFSSSVGIALAAGLGAIIGAVVGTLVFRARGRRPA